MPKLKSICPLCNKNLELREELHIGNEILNSYKCGHTFSKDSIELKEAELDFTARDLSGKVARDYQKEGVKFIIESDFNCIIGDQMRLGKTPQSLLALANRLEDRLPVLFIVRSANIWQWIREYRTWTNPLPHGIFPILGTEGFIVPGFDAYIISMDTFSQPAKCKCGHRFHDTLCKSHKGKCPCKIYQSNGNSVADKLKAIPFRLVIADEAHSFKNTDSNRSQVLTDFVNFLNTGEDNKPLEFNCSHCGKSWEVAGKITYDKRIGHRVISKSSECPDCGTYCYMQQQRGETKRTNEACGLVLLTGTAIKNRADEYFVPLNLVAPNKFYSLSSFRNQWLEQNYKGQYSKVKSYLLEAFKKEIKPYVLRREKEDVYTDLPKLNRIFTVIEPNKDALANQYNRILDKMESKLAEKYNPSYWDLAEDMMALRRICGLMKVPWVKDYLEVSLEDSDNQRYAVGIHHKDVRDVLYHGLDSDQNCLKLSGEDNAWAKDKVMRDFATSPQRILIINMLAGGVGMDFHYCDNVLILERQWSSADEEQFEFRFYNPDLSIKQNPTNIEYVVAKGTIDEFFYDLVEEKRKVFGETIGNNWNLQTDSTGTFKDLIARTVGSRL